MIDLSCPVCIRQVSCIEKWRGIYLCTPCRKKYEKIEFLIKNGQVLNTAAIRSIIVQFGQEEVKEIKKAKNLTIV